jgi:hypothetical protein
MTRTERSYLTAQAKIQTRNARGLTEGRSRMPSAKIARRAYELRQELLRAGIDPHTVGKRSRRRRTDYAVIR